MRKLTLIAILLVYQSVVAQLPTIDSLVKHYGYYVEPVSMYVSNAGADTGVVMLNSLTLDSCNYWTPDSVSMFFRDSLRDSISGGWYDTLRLITSIGDTVRTIYPIDSLRYYVLRPMVVKP